MSSKLPVKIGIIGAGRNTKDRHIPGFQAIENVEIVSVCNRSIRSTEKAAEQFGIRKIHKNWLELVNDPEIDAVLIGTWPYMHCAITLASLHASKHVICEARMAMNANQARQMLTASENRPDLIAQIVPSPLTLGFDGSIKKIISDNRLGDIRVIEVKALDYIKDDDQFHWRQDFEFSGYNTLSLGIWYEAIMRWVGPANKVTAHGETFVKSRPDMDGCVKAVKIYDYLDVAADMACGAQLNMLMTSALPGRNESFCIIYGSKGRLKVTGNSLEIAEDGSDTFREVEIEENLKGKWRVEDEFIGAIRGEEKISLTTFKDGLKYMEFTESVIKSSEKGKSFFI